MLVVLYNYAAVEISKWCTGWIKVELLVFLPLFSVRYLGWHLEHRPIVLLRYGLCNVPACVHFVARRHFYRLHACPFEIEPWFAFLSNLNAFVCVFRS